MCMSADVDADTYFILIFESLKVASLLSLLLLTSTYLRYSKYYFAHLETLVELL